MSNALLAYDPATVTGWACADGDSVRYGYVDFGMLNPKNESMEQRHGRIFAKALHRFEDDLCRIQPQAVYFESVGVGQCKSSPSMWIYAGVRGALLHACHSTGTLALPVSTGDWKKLLTGNGSMHKEGVRKSVEALGYPVERYDESDALGILAKALADHHTTLKAFKPVRIKP